MKKYILPIILLALLLMPTVLAEGNVKINDFYANTTNGTIPLHTRFYSDVTGNITTWRWFFINTETGATTFSGANITTHHNFGKPGIYNVTLKVWGPEGNDTLTKPYYINALSASTGTNNINGTAATVNPQPATTISADSTESIVESTESVSTESIESVNTETYDSNVYWDHHHHHHHRLYKTTEESNY